MALKAGIVVAVLLAVAYVFLRGGDVTGADARQLVESGARLVDVRTREEFVEEHIPKAINIPVQELDARLGELGPRDEPIVLYCRSGNRSGRAAGMLKSAGYSSVHDLGAMSRW